MNAHRILLTVSLAAYTVLAHSQGSGSVHDVAQRVDAHYNHLTSLQCHYTEHYSGMGLDRTESGTLLLKKPGRMRWQYSQPAGKLFVLDGKNAYFYSPGDAQAQRVPAKQLDDLRSPLRLLLGHTKLEKELDNLTLTQSGSTAILSGVPKGMEQRVKSLTVTVASATGVIVALRLEEMDGAVTEFHFENMKENVPVSDTAFHFEAPEGVSIVSGLVTF